MMKVSGRCSAVLLMTLIVGHATTALAQSAVAAPMAVSENDGADAGVTADPCAALEPAPEVVTAYMIEAAKARSAKRPPPVPSKDALAVYNAWQGRLAAKDFSGRCSYERANHALAPTTDHRVVLFGDSITQLWGAMDPDFFKGDTINRGVSGQTTAQMIGRFRADAIEPDPKVILILAGTNDIAGNTGPTSLARIEDNIQAMAELAKAHGIRIILGSVLPTSGYNWRPAIRPVDTIRSLNGWLQAYAQRNGLLYVDYYTVLVDADGGFKKALTTDGVHPNVDGYKVMRPLAELAIQQVLQAAGR